MSLSKIILAVVFGISAILLFFVLFNFKTRDAAALNEPDKKEHIQASYVPPSQNKVIKDSVISECCTGKTIIVKKGNNESCRWDRSFIESSLSSKVKDVRKLNYCFQSGLITTGSKSIDSMEVLKFRYFIISDFEKEKSLTIYSTALAKSTFDRVTPAMEAPYTSYLFLSGDNLVILSHYGLPNYYPAYNINEYIDLLRKR